MLTEPAPSLPAKPLLSTSPSLATSTFWPSAVKTSMSGCTPTWTEPTTPWVAALMKTTCPGWDLSVASSATATMPFLTATLVTSVEAKPKVVKLRVVISAGAAGFDRSTTCRPLLEVTNRRSLPGSKAEISAPASVNVPLTSMSRAPVGVVETSAVMSKLATRASWSLAWLANSAFM